ncbi:MAG: OmpA family protein [Arcticibacter sp.]
MGQPVVKFYKGIFHSQFISTRFQDQKGLKSADIQLEQRFILNVTEELTLEQYELAKESRFSKDSIKWQSAIQNAHNFTPAILQPHVILTANNPIELVFNDGDSIREVCSELYVEFEDNFISTRTKENDFTAFKDGHFHGRITGKGCVRIPVLSEKEKEKLSLELLTAEGKNRRGCLTPFLPYRGSSFLGGVRGWGGFSRFNGCSQTGCGFLGLLLLLSLLLTTWRSCDKQTGVGGPRVIHDTIYVDENSKKDVIKQFLDTTTVFKTEAIELPNVQFYSNSSKLLPYSINSIQQLADYLIAHPKIHAIIEGHTDNTGDPLTNLNLSQERAETVRQVLVSFGVDPIRVEAKGYGKNHPRADNSTLEGRAMNRRVEVRLTNTEQSETKSTEVNK